MHWKFVDAAAEWLLIFGRYEASEEEYEGAPVYRNGNFHLYRGGAEQYGKWHFGDRMPRSGYIQSIPATTAECPDGVSEWYYWDKKADWNTGDIKVEC